MESNTPSTTSIDSSSSSVPLPNNNPSSSSSTSSSTTSVEETKPINKPLLSFLDPTKTRDPLNIVLLLVGVLLITRIYFVDLGGDVGLNSVDSENENTNEFSNPLGTGSKVQPIHLVSNYMKNMNMKKYLSMLLLIL